MYVTFVATRPFSSSVLEVNFKPGNIVFRVVSYERALETEFLVFWLNILLFRWLARTRTKVCLYVLNITSIRNQRRVPLHAPHGLRMLNYLHKTPRSNRSFSFITPTFFFFFFYKCPYKTIYDKSIREVSKYLVLNSKRSHEHIGFTITWIFFMFVPENTTRSGAPIVRFSTVFRLKITSNWYYKGVIFLIVSLFLLSVKKKLQKNYIETVNTQFR